MQMNQETIDILRHFSKFTQSVIFEPDQNLYVVSHQGDFIYARAKVEHEFPERVPCHDIGLLVNLIKLFDGIEYDIDFGENSMSIVSDDKKYSQQFAYADEDIIKTPKAEKIDKYFEAEPLVEFDLDHDTLKRFRSAIRTNNSTNAVFETIDGKLYIYGANSSLSGKIEQTTNSFKIDTGVETEEEINVSIRAENFVIADGSYTVGIFDRFLTFKSETVDYIMPSLLQSD